jgi:hypothetical protein
VPLSGAGKACLYFSKEEFAYDPELNIYQCPAGKLLRPKTIRAARNQLIYNTEPGTCESCSRCSLKPRTGMVFRQVLRLRRLEKVNIEALVIASAQNKKRLVAARERAPRKLAQAAALRPPDQLSGCRPHLSGQWPSLARAKEYFNRLASS